MTKLIVTLGFLTAFIAGLMVGLRQRHDVAAPLVGGGGPASRSAFERRGPGGWLAEQLKLTADQQKQLDQIWSETARRGGPQQEERRRQIRKERDDAIAALVRPDDKSAYESIVKKYSDALSVLEAEWRAGFEQAVKRTEEILTPEQRSDYQKLRKQGEQWFQRGRNSNSGAGQRHGEHNGDEPSSTTAPTDHEAPATRQ